MKILLKNRILGSVVANFRVRWYYLTSLIIFVEIRGGFEEVILRNFLRAGEEPALNYFYYNFLLKGS
jgi:hypothetical protein